MVSFPVPGVDGMHESLHGLKSQGFALLAHDIFDSFCQTRVVSDDHRYGKPAGLPGMGLAGAGTGDYI